VFRRALAGKRASKVPNASVPFSPIAYGRASDTDGNVCARCYEGRMAASKKKPAGRAANLLRALTLVQRASVLEQLVRDDAKIRARAEQLADDILTSVDVDTVADEVADAVDVDSDEIYGRTGPSPDGYVDPVEEAWECLQERVRPFLDDLRERLRQGRVEEASRICQGILIGLYGHRHEDATTDKAFGLAPDFLGEACSEALRTYFGRGGGKRKQRATAPGRRPELPEEFWLRVPEWSGFRERWGGHR
jgi:hypothetical protein